MPDVHKDHDTLLPQLTKRVISQSSGSDHNCISDVSIGQESALCTLAVAPQADTKHIPFDHKRADFPDDPGHDDRIDIGSDGVSVFVSPP